MQLRFYPKESSIYHVILFIAILKYNGGGMKIKVDRMIFGTQSEKDVCM